MGTDAAPRAEFVRRSASAGRLAIVLLGLLAAGALVEVGIGALELENGRTTQPWGLIVFPMAAVAGSVLMLVLRRRRRAAAEGIILDVEFRSLAHGFLGNGTVEIADDRVRLHCTGTAIDTIPFGLFLGRTMLRGVLPLGPVSAAVEFALALVAARLVRPDAEANVAPAAFRRVEDRPSVVRFVFEAGGREVVLDAAPKDYATREKLLRELALRCPEALERGIESPAAEKAKPQVQPENRAAQDVEVGGIRGPTDRPLGSDLADLAAHAKPSIPRSPLGSGLFPERR